jgi:hypothetical protein
VRPASLCAFGILLAILIATGFIYPHGPREIVSLPDRQSRLPGDSAVIYPSEDAANAACQGWPVAFADMYLQVYYEKGEPQYDSSQERGPAQYGFGCEDDLETNGFHHA